MATDYYELLGISRSATDDEIKRAYRRLARELHPDVNPGDPGAEARFKEITVAHETLRDPERRRRYDLFGPDEAGTAAGAGPMGEVFDLGDLFGAFFGGDAFGARQRGSAGPPRGADAQAVLELTLTEAAFGITTSVPLRLPIVCARCKGDGCEPGTHPARCETCAGTGQVRQVRRSILGQIVTAGPCMTCGASGTVIHNPCPDCRGEGRVVAESQLEVEVPAGIDDGQRLRLTGRGPAGPRGGLPGDLYVTVRVLPHPAFERRGDDLFHVRRVAMTQAVLGARFVVDTLDGPEELVVPAGTQPGRVFRLKGRGVPALRGRGRGDLLVQIDVEVPDRLTEDEAELLRRFAALRGDDVTEPSEGGLFSRIRSAFQ